MDAILSAPCAVSVHSGSLATRERRALACSMTAFGNARWTLRASHRTMLVLPDWAGPVMATVPAGRSGIGASEPASTPMTGRPSTVRSTSRAGISSGRERIGAGRVR